MITLSLSPLSLAEIDDCVYRARPVSLADDSRAAVAKARAHLLHHVERRMPIYGVTTGFGDSCFRFIEPSDGERLQHNLVSYLLCGTGEALPNDAVRATLLIRLKSLSRGYSGVSPELLERMVLFLNRDWIPVVPREGSLGASGDLVPLAYLAQALRGEGRVQVDGLVRATAEVLREAGVEPYTLGPKEALALVNGTSAMAGLAFCCLKSARRLVETSTIATAWMCLALGGRTEPFGELVNEKAGRHAGQADAARAIRARLDDEQYVVRPLTDVEIRDSQTVQFVQDRYSLRCAPQILGPVLETITLADRWLEDEVNGTSDNPLLDHDGALGMGGNFYGGYLSQGMDYLKISLAHVADMVDRQITMVMDEKSNRGLPPNLANWPGLPAEQRFLHHGLKGLHQAISAITSEIMAKAMPNGIFSRSSESHNQDKVSLGMSAAVQTNAMLDQLANVQALALVCLAQALDLRGVKLRGATSRALYDQVRKCVPFVSHDQPLEDGVRALSQHLRSAK